MDLPPLSKNRAPVLSASVYGNVVTVAPSVPFMQQAPLNNQNSGNFCTHTDVQCSV